MTTKKPSPKKTKGDVERKRKRTSEAELSAYMVIEELNAPTKTRTKPDSPEKYDPEFPRKAFSGVIYSYIGLQYG
jgi:hypothetical protein